MSESIFEYEGRLYVGPVGRGISLDDGRMTPLDDALAEALRVNYTAGGYTPRVRITVQVVEDET